MKQPARLPDGLLRVGMMSYFLRLTFLAFFTVCGIAAAAIGGGVAAAANLAFLAARSSFSASRQIEYRPSLLLRSEAKASSGCVMLWRLQNFPPAGTPAGAAGTIVS